MSTDWSRPSPAGSSVDQDDRRWWRREMAPLLAVAVVLFVAISAAVWHRHGPFGPDRPLVDALRASKGDVTFGIARNVSFFGSPPVVAVIAILIGVLVWRRARRVLVGVTVPLAAGLAGLSESVIKHVVARPRPPGAALVAHGVFGFPSGHTAGATSLVVALAAVVTTIWATNRLMWWLLGAVAAVSIGISRIVIGAHWPTDVLGGFLMGVAAALTVLAGCQLASRHTPALPGRIEAPPAARRHR